MNSNFLHQRGINVLLGFMLVFGFILASSTDVYSQNRPNIPVLSLTGDQDDYNDKWYPDGLIRMVPSDHVSTFDEAKLIGREFLMPIFIDNKWTKYPGVGEIVDGITGSIKGDMYVPDEIHSFEFKLMYDSTVLRPIGWAVAHPFEDQDDERFQTIAGEYYEPLAKDFHIEMHDWADTSYRWFIFGDEPANPNDKKQGRTLKITGTSLKPMPHCNLGATDYRILMYVKFKVVTTGGGAFPKPIYIMNDTIKYNDMNVSMDCPFIEFRGLPGYDPSIFDNDYTDPNPTDNPRYYVNNRGLAGLTNYAVNAPTDVNQQSVFAQTNQIFYRPGVIWIKFSGATPSFDFYVPDTFLSYPIATEPDNPEYKTLVEPITMDSNAVPPASRNIFLRNNLDDSRLLDIEIESDQKWLKFRTVQGPTNQNPIFIPTTKGRITMIDRGILGEFDENDPVDRDTEDDGDIELQVICDPEALDAIPETEEDGGIYVGYLTFKSAYANISPLRLKITFIYFKVPDEWQDKTRHPGMEILVKNSSGDSKSLIFGSGSRATRSVDSIYGEHAYRFPMDATFDARWFPPEGWTKTEKTTEIDEQSLLENGYGDFAPNAWTPRSNSRDIRRVDDDEQSLVYLCKFTMGDPNDYPTTVEWDVRDFPDGSSLFLRDVLNGEYFNVDMVNGGTSLGGTRRSYTIEDANFRSFIIEYTPARTIEYVDDEGKPKIKKGWNLLSLPVRPVNTMWNVVYKYAINVPYFYSNAQYQDDAILKPGIGYFVKYHDQVDKIFSGSYFYEISRLTGIPVKLYSGWNTIGALSVISSIYDIEFEPFEDAPTPTRSYTRAYGVYGYKTNTGYEEVSLLEPGLGYWIKVGIDNDPVSSEMSAGYLRLVSSIPYRMNSNGILSTREEAYSNSALISIKDNAQHSGKVYLTSDNSVNTSMFELPPAPSAGMFDVRFTNNRMLDNSDESVIKLQGVTYPLSISVSNADDNYTFVDGVTGLVLGSINKGDSKNIEVRHLSNETIKVVKSSSVNSLSVYPNPAQNMMNIKFDIIELADVTIKIYDIVGNEVASMFREYTEAGMNTSIPFNVSGLNAGAYICKMFNGSTTVVSTFTVVK